MESLRKALARCYIVVASVKGWFFYELAKHLNVIVSIQNAAPTDGLFGDSRTDEEQIGASYDELEWAMKMKDEGRLHSNFSGRELEVFTIYCKLNTINQHKMNPIPVCEITNKLK